MRSKARTAMDAITGYFIDRPPRPGRSTWALTSASPNADV
jgi:hypothetical protein